MPTPAKEIIFGTINKNVDSSALTNESELLRDGYVDDLGNPNVRPGLKPYIDTLTTAAIDGLFWSDLSQVWIAVSNSKIFKISVDGIATDISGGNLLTRNLVTFSEFKYQSTVYLFMANGSGLNFTNYTANVQTLSATSTPALTGTLTLPTEITHVVNFHAKLIINDSTTNSFYFSYPINPFKFDTADSYDAEKHPDKISALVLNNDRLLVCGIKTIETWYDAGSPGDPFITKMGISSLDAGVLAPSSISVVDETRIIFLNKDRRVASITGSKFEILSENYDKEIQSFETVSDARGFIVHEGGNSFYILNFPTEYRTLVYDLTLKQWYEWSYWVENLGIYVNFIGNCYAYSKDLNKHLIGSFQDGKIYEFSSKYASDDGAAIRSVFRTGHINWGSQHDKKISGALTASFSRGKGKEGDPHSKAYCYWRKRDNGDGPWGPYYKVDLGSLGETSMRRALLRRGGQYFSRQYEFVFPDDTSVCLSGLYEVVKLA